MTEVYEFVSSVLSSVLSQLVVDMNPTRETVALMSLLALLVSAALARSGRTSVGTGSSDASPSERQVGIGNKEITLTVKMRSTQHPSSREEKHNSAPAARQSTRIEGTQAPLISGRSRRRRGRGRKGG